MNIKTDNSAVIATLNRRIENLERYNLGLANESCEQQRKIAELEIHLKQTLDNSISQASALRDCIAELEKENACLNSANNTLHNLMVSGEKRGVEKATQEFSSKIAELEEDRPSIEHGKNRYGVDVAYFRKTINRELNRDLSNFKPDELARVLARLSVTSDSSVIHEKEFQAKALKEQGK